MQKYSFFLSFLLAALVLGAFAPAHAETLDDATIRQVYGDMKGAIRNPERLSQLMAQRLDDNYILKSNVTRIVGNNTPQQLSGSMMKKQFIEDTVKNMSSAKIQNYQSNITSIQYSEDGKYATVADTSTTAGIIGIPTQQGGMTDVKYEGKETCTHIVTLMGDMVKIMQSQCDDQITLNR